MNKRSIDIKQWEEYAELYNQGKGTAGDKLHNSLIQPLLDNFLGNYSAQTVLDAGCGNGFLTHHLAKKAKKVIGIDISEKLLQYAVENKKGDNVSFKKVDLTKRLLFQGNQFDLVISVMVLQYLPEIEKFVSESSRVLKKGGKLIVIIDHPAHALFLQAQELAG